MKKHLLLAFLLLSPLLLWGYPPGKCGGDYKFGMEQLYRWHSPSMAGIEFAKSCRNGCGKGCFMMGKLLELGWGEPKNLKEALSYYRQACQLRMEKGCKRAKIVIQKMKRGK